MHWFLEAQNIEGQHVAESCAAHNGNLDVDMQLDRAAGSEAPGACTEAIWSRACPGLDPRFV